MKKGAPSGAPFQLGLKPGYLHRIFRRATPTAPNKPVPNNSMVLGSGTPPGTATSLTKGCGTFWNLTKIALQICASVNPVNAAPLTVKLALSPGSRPSPTEPPLKLPEGPVMNPKSSTTLLNPSGTLPRAPSEKVKFEDKLGACIPVNPFNPEALAFPSGGKSKPIPVIVDVEPGNVIADVLVMVKVNVFVWELNSQTTVAVDRCPEPAPVTVIVFAFAAAAAAIKTNTDVNVRNSF